MDQLRLFQEAGKAFSQATDRETAFLEAMEEGNARELFLLHIESRLTYWWDKDPEQIPRLLYRIDVEEENARAAFLAKEPIKSLAVEIVKRLEKTAMSRLEYREKNA